MTIDHRPSTIDHRPSTIDHRPSTIDHRPFGRLMVNKIYSGFTLLEMLVVIGIIALIATWAIPGVRRAYKDFMFRRSAENLDVIYGSIRAYYLVFNEYPDDTSSDLIKKNVVWAFPSNFYTRTLNGTAYYLNVRPYEEGMTLKYDIDNFISSRNDIKAFAITIKQADGTGNSTTNHWSDFLEERYPYAQTRIIGGSTLLCYPEIAEPYITDAKIYRNRYY
ncbi:MAG: type II secretion system protein [bacterium]